MRLSSPSHKVQISIAKRRLRAIWVLTVALAGVMGLSFGSMVRFRVTPQENTVFDPEQSFPPLADWPPSAPIAEDGRSLRFEDLNPAAIRHTRTATEAAGIVPSTTAALDRSPTVEITDIQEEPPLEDIAITSPNSSESPFESSPWLDPDRPSFNTNLETTKPSSQRSTRVGNSSEFDSPATPVEIAPAPVEGTSSPLRLPNETLVEPATPDPNVPSTLAPAPSPDNQSNGSFKFDTSRSIQPSPNPSANLSEQSSNSRDSDFSNLVAPL